MPDGCGGRSNGGAVAWISDRDPDLNIVLIACLRLLDIGGRGGRPPILRVLIRWQNRLNGGKMVHISQILARFRRKPRDFS